MLQREDKPGTIDVLGENLSFIRDMYREEGPYTEGSDISDHLRKLYDHVSLDIARITYSESADRNLSSQGAISNITAKVEELHYKMETAFEAQRNLDSDLLNIEIDLSEMKESVNNAKRLSTEFVSIQQETNALKEKLADAQKEYISILGIFAAVVLAFIGGSMFSSSVLESMSSTNIYRVIFIVDFLAFVVVSLVYLLVSFIIGNQRDTKIQTNTSCKDRTLVGEETRKNRNRKI